MTDHSFIFEGQTSGHSFKLKTDGIRNNPFGYNGRMYKCVHCSLLYFLDNPVGVNLTPIFPTTPTCDERIVRKVHEL